MLLDFLKRLFGLMHIGRKRALWDGEIFYEDEFTEYDTVNEETQTTDNIKEDAYFNADKIKRRLLQDNCKKIIDVNKQLEEAVLEYKVICSYISDVQKIELVEKEDKKRLLEAANKIVKLTQEQERYKKRKVPKIRADQYAIIQKYDDIIVDEIHKLEDYEKNCNIVKSDLDKLEGERSILKHEREAVVSYQNFLKFFSKFVAASMGIVYLIIVLIYFSLHIDMIIPITIATVIAAGSVLYIVTVSRNNAYKLDINEKKYNKLITLFNKVKIKYYNSYNLMDYVRNKYGVRNSKELKYIWDRYITEKEAIIRHSKSIELYDVYQDSLIRQLNKINVDDTKVWTNQISALIDPKEMKEIRERLDGRRVNLKKRIDSNNKILEDSKSSIREIVQENDEYKLDVISILKKYKIDIQ